MTYPELCVGGRLIRFQPTQFVRRANDGSVTPRLLIEGADSLDRRGVPSRAFSPVVVSDLLHDAEVSDA